VSQLSEGVLLETGPVDWRGPRDADQLTLRRGEGGGLVDGLFGGTRFSQLTG
jgi:hypothetical protein